MTTNHRNRLFLVRHAENQANIHKVFSSRKVDHSLTAKGVKQARQTADYFAELGLIGKRWHKQVVFSSPLKRAIETSEIMASKLELGIDIVENLREIEVGALEDSPGSASDWSSYRRVIRDWFDGRHDSRFPGGESYNELWARTRDGLLAITGEADDSWILIVGHGGLFTVTMKDICPQIDVKWLRSALVDNCGITIIDLKRKDGDLQGRLVEWNSHDHLSGEAADLVPGVPDEG